MADKKISDLTAATSAATDDVYEIENSGGNSRKVTGAQIKTLAVGWTLVSSNSPSAVANIDFTGLSGYNEILIVARALTCTVSGVRMAQVSTDNGSTWDTTVANYQQVSQLGVESNADAAAIAYHGTASTSARDLIAHIINLKGAVKVCNPFNYVSNRGPIMYVGSANDITAIRITNSGGGNISGGPIYIFGR